jgi:hypothetical protein
MPKARGIPTEELIARSGDDTIYDANRQEADQVNRVDYNRLKQQGPRK